LKAYAQLRGVNPNAVRYQCERGVIVRREADGFIDSDQADASWNPFKVKGRDPAFDRRRRQVEVAGHLVKANLLKVQLERLQTRYVERSVAEAILFDDVRAILDMLRTAPARYAASLAAVLDVQEELARAVLERLIASGLDDLGDLRAQADQVITRL